MNLIILLRRNEMNTDRHMQNLLYTISVIADPDYQYRIWVKGLGPEVDSFEERMCRFFESIEFALPNYKKYGVSKEQYQLLIEFRDALEIFCDSVPEIVDEEKEILPNPEWHKIQNFAKKVLKAFDYKKDKKYIFYFD